MQEKFIYFYTLGTFIIQKNRQMTLALQEKHRKHFDAKHS